MGQGAQAATRASVAGSILKAGCVWCPSDESAPAQFELPGAWQTRFWVPLAKRHDTASAGVHERGPEWDAVRSKNASMV